MSDVHPDALRRERKNVSVLKVDLARLRERHKCRMVIVLEGKDDLPVYDTWVKRIEEEFDWEPLVAKGKGKALQFRELLRRDQTGIGLCTYFIIDHDYDGMRGYPSGDDVFLLPAYSVENYLTHESVLDSYLRTELRVIGRPELRQQLVALYGQLRTEFIELVRRGCEYLYGARNESVGNVAVGEPKSTVVMRDGKASTQAGDWVDGLVVSERDVSEDGLARGREFFDQNFAPLWIRGKFLLAFFIDFCGLLYEDRVCDQPVLFDEKVSDKSLSPAGLDLRNLAAKAPLPEGLRETLMRWREDCHSACLA
jgi:hypothetical protein